MRRIMTTIGAAALMAWPASLAGQQGADAMAKGAEVWANNCVRCHNVRPSTERTDAQWTVIVSHMRARANLTRTQARTVSVFLQMTNAPEGPGAVEVTPPQPAPPESGDEVTLSESTLRQLARYLVRMGAMEPPGN